MQYCLHLPTAKIRRIVDRRGAVLYFSQVIKYTDGRTEYSADASECNIAPPGHTPRTHGFDFHCAQLSQKMKLGRTIK